MTSIALKNSYVNKLKKISIKCFSKNLHNAENAINYSHRYMSMVYEYLQKIKEELDSIDHDDINYFKVLSLFNVNKIYTNEIDYIITNAIYDDKNLIIKSKDNEYPEILEFTLALPYNFQNNYPIGIPISTVPNNYNFKYICPILDNNNLFLDIYLNSIDIKIYELNVNFTIVPDNLTIIKCNNAYGLFIKKKGDNLCIIHSYYNHSDFNNSNNIINIDNTVIYGNITNVCNESQVTNLEKYDKFSYFITFLQYSIDNSLNITFNEIDKISEYLYLCEINYNLLKTYKIY